MAAPASGGKGGNSRFVVYIVLAVVAYYAAANGMLPAPVEDMFRSVQAAPTVRLTNVDHPPPSSSGTLNRSQLARLAADAGCSRPRLAAAVAMAESSGRVTVAGDGGESIGLWQIHMPSHPQYSRSELRDPRRNAQAACRIASQGRGWNNWTTYRTGAYRRYQ